MIFSSRHVITELDIGNKGKLFEFIAHQAFEDRIVKDKEKIINSFWQRELEVSTGLTDGFAIPHVKSDSVINPSIYFIKLKNSINWESLDNQPVKYIFALLVPITGASNLHLQMISKLATSLLDEDFTQKIISSTNTEEIASIINNAMKGDWL